MSTKPAPSRPRAAIYARISSDRSGERKGVVGQVDDCRELADRLGWDIAAVYVDNDVSAYSGKPRPEYREMLAAVRAGRIDAILAWHTDRLHRRPTELEEFISLVETHHTLIQTVKAGSLDLSTPSGQMVARMLGAAARHEVDQTRGRIAAQKRRAAAAGEYRGGVRPFGYEPGGMVVRPAEAAMALEATKAIIAGRSLRSIANDWNERGLAVTREWKVKDEYGQVVKNADGTVKTRPVTKPWSALTVREMVLRPRNAGIIAHGIPGKKASKTHKYDFKVLTDEEGKPIRAAWPPIVPEDDWLAAVKVLTDPSRRDFDGTRDRAHLGSGLYICGGERVDENGQTVPCGTLMRSGTHGGGRGHYRCRLPGKGHVMVLLKQTDEYVREQVAKLIRDPRIVAAMTPAAPDMADEHARRDALYTRLDRYDADYKAGEITAAERRAFRAEAEADIAAIEEKITAAMRSATSLDVLSAPDPGAAFLAAPLDMQRAVLASLMVVEIVPNEHRGRVWTKDRLRLHPVIDVDVADAA